MKIVHIIAAGILFLLSLSISTMAEAAEAENPIDIGLLPNEELFNIADMKPGDWAPRTVTIQNKGKMDFDYLLQIKPAGDSLKLYNELLLEVRDQQTELFNGKLADFQSLPPRLLDAGVEEELQLTIRFPEHLGNAFQGLNAAFTLHVIAKGDEMANGEGVVIDQQNTIGTSSGSGQTGGIGAQLPKTATNIFNLILIGGILFAAGRLIAFYYKNVKQS